VPKWGECDNDWDWDSTPLNGYDVGLYKEFKGLHTYKHLRLSNI